MVVPAALRSKCLSAAVAGAALGSCYLPSGTGWPAWAALAALLWCVEDEPPLRAFFLSWLFGVCAWGVALLWFVRVSLEFAAGPGFVRFLFALGVIAYHGLMLPVSAGAARWLAGRLDWEPRLALAVCAVPCWTATEGLFPQVYPCCMATTQLGHLPAVQSLDLAGPGGVAWLIFTVNAALYYAIRKKRWGALALALGVLGLNEAYGRARIRQVDAQVSSAKSLRVSVLQGVLPLMSRNTAASAEPDIAFYRDLTRKALAEGHAELVVWPHNTYERTVRFGAQDPALEHPLLPEGQLAADVPFPTHVLLSASGESPATQASSWPSRHYVTILKDPAGGVAGVTSKVVPTPLAEAMPFGDWLPALYRLRPKLKRLVPGASRVLTMADGRRLGVVICYDAVTTSVARRLAASGAQVLVNPSSDQWSFDRRVQPEQHLRIVTLRAIENRRAFVRATPSGVSVVVDPAGRVLRSLPVDVTGAFTQDVPLLDGRTPFMALGDAAYWLALAAVGLLWRSRS